MSDTTERGDREGQRDEQHGEEAAEAATDKAESEAETEAEQEEATDQYPGHLAGNRVSDTQEDGKHLRVVARTPWDAENSRIAAIGKSVYEVNDCPPDAPVYVCAYESSLDERFGAKWQDWSGAYLAFMVGNFGLQTYSFPATRLAKAEDRPAEKWQQAAEDGGGA